MNAGVLNVAIAFSVRNSVFEHTVLILTPLIKTCAQRSVQKNLNNFVG